MATSSETVAYFLLANLFFVTRLLVLPTTVQMLGYTGSILYLGSHHSLSVLGTDATSSEQPLVAALSKKDAMMIPVVGSLALCCLFVAYTFFSKYWVNLPMTTYLIIVGVLAMAESLRPAMLAFVPSASKKVLRYINVSLVDAAAYACAVGISGAYMYTKSWTLHNVLGVSFAIFGVSRISLSRFGVAFISMWGVFVYDVFWVFCTEVMVKVAMNFEGPIKIIIPVSFQPWKQSIMGLGDIVFPGIFVAMCLRFDADRHRKRSSTSQDRNTCTDFPKPYFFAAYIAYLVALLLTALIMMHFKRAQPALLYLVPFTSLAVVGTALARGELKDVFAFDESTCLARSEEKPTECSEKVSGRFPDDGAQVFNQASAGSPARPKIE